MDIFSWWKLLTWLFDKIIDKYKFWNTKKENEKNIEIMQSRLKSVFNNHENDIEKLFTDVLDGMKEELLWKEDPQSNWLIGKLDDMKDWNLLDNIDKTAGKVEQNKVLVFFWKTFFYDNKIRELEENLKINIDNFLDIYSRETSIYFSSNWVADIKLLKKEKNEILKMLKLSIYEFEKIILEKLQWLVKLSIVDSIKPNTSTDNDKINNMIKNVEKFANDIEEWKMIKYYNRMLKILDIMIDEMIGKLKK